MAFGGHHKFLLLQADALAAHQTGHTGPACGGISHNNGHQTGRQDHHQ